MEQPRIYKALTKPSDAPDPFTGKTQREVVGYYVKHIEATPPPIATNEQRQEFLDQHARHYIFCDGFSDWNLPRDLEQWEIDPNTLQEANGTT